MSYNSTLGTQVMALIEFRGDDFIAEQIRRIVGSVVAICNGWLPNNFIEQATNMETFVETPLAPVNHMYFSEARFHFHELVDGGKLFEQDGVSSESALRATTELQNRIMARICSPRVRHDELQWIASLEEDVARRIRNQLQKLSTTTDSPPKSSNGTKMPHAYGECLSLLRDIATSGRWPKTSSARSRIIKKSNSVSNDDDSEINDMSKTIDAGSFTIINPKFDKGSLMNDDRIRIPLGNELFPELVEAIFNLEELLSNDPDSKTYQRPPSSHCAVNRNAQFTPHVDSGRGLGQSLSMIVGLGDYTGGALLIEGESHDIRYNPVEFDGWKQRHWTALFSGERYSLVWFTPEIS
jgi:hypothetical protein